MRPLFVGLLVASLLLASCIANALDVNDPDLLLYLPFNDDVEDSSKNARDGVIVGAAKFVEGKHGQALEFGEAGEVKAPHIPFNEKSFTVCMWVKPALTGTDQQCIFGQHQSGSQNVSLHFRIYTDSRIRMGFYSNDLDAPAGVIKKDEWAHITFWLDVDEGKRRVYVNGKQIVEDAGKAGIEYKGTSGDTYVGAWRASNQRFNGVIDEVQVWNRALSEKEILQSMEDLSSGKIAVDASGKLAAKWGKLKAEQ